MLRSAAREAQPVRARGGMRACASPPSPLSLARVLVHHHTIPRTYIFHRESPTFATIISVAAVLVRATHVREVHPSCRVHAETGSYDPLARLRVSFGPRCPTLRTMYPLIETAT